MPFLYSKEEIIESQISNIEDLIFESEKLKPSDYSEQSWARYQKALNRGIEAMKDSDQDPDKLQEIIREIQIAKENLAKSHSYYREMPYESVARYPEKYKKKEMMVKGYVIQSEDDMLLVATDLLRSYDMDAIEQGGVIYIEIDSKTKKDGRLLKGDEVSIYGTCMGVKSYENHEEHKLTVPSLLANEIVNHSAN